MAERDTNASGVFDACESRPSTHVTDAGRNRWEHQQVLQKQPALMRSMSQLLYCLHPAGPIQQVLLQLVVH